MTARYSDGASAAIGDVAVGIDTEARALVLRDAAGTEVARWPFADLVLVRAPDGGGGGLLRGGPQHAARLHFADGAILARLRALGAMPPAPAGAQADRRAAALLVAATLALLALFIVVLPALAVRIAEAIPPAWAARLGDSQVDAMARILAAPNHPSPICGGIAGTAALAALTARLQDVVQLEPPPRVLVVDSARVNAYALPGSRILLSRGLIALAEDGDELAFVLAHELAHAATRDPFRQIVMHALGGALAATLAGHAGLQMLVEPLAARLVSTASSRHMEDDADRRALLLLEASGLSRAGAARILERFLTLQSAGLMPLATHPPSAARVAQARSGGTNGAAALSPEGFLSVRRICSAASHQRVGTGFSPV